MLWLHKTQGGCSREERRDPSTHPSSGRVDNVRSFHSAQKASLRSQFSSDTWQLSSEVAMISFTPSSPLLPGPLNSPLLPLLQGLFSAPLASDAKSRAKTLMGDSGPRAGVGVPGLSLVPGWRSASEEIQDTAVGAGVLSDTSRCLILLRHCLRPGTCPASCHLGTCPPPHPFPLTQGGQWLVCKQSRKVQDRRPLWALY